MVDSANSVHFPWKWKNRGSKYADNIFISYLLKQLSTATKLDVVWDAYIPETLKELTCDKRGKGVQRKVSVLSKFPSNWMDFLHDAKNKEELFSFLTSRVIQHHFPSHK